MENSRTETFVPPSREEIRAAAEAQYLEMDEEELDAYHEAVAKLEASYQRLLELANEHATSSTGKEREWWVPSEDDNPHNSYVIRCGIQGSDAGALAAYTIGIKDNTAIAGLPLTCGGSVLADHISQQDATLVTRLLEEGASINGKLNMSDMGYDGTGLLNSHGPLLNPRDDDYMAGGSSGGSAAAVVEGLVDAAIGGDQGGSIRIPASWCGCVGLKPTYGLVPYTGIVGMEPSNDHAGPLALTVRDCARVLDVIAGPDGLDPRQHPGIEQAEYEQSLSNDASDISIGIVSEGFRYEAGDSRVDETVRSKLAEFAEYGATLAETSVPMHADGEAIFNGIEIEGMTALLRDQTVGRYLRGYYDTDRAAAYGPARKQRADEYPPTLKRVLLMGEYLQQEYHGQFYTMAQNLRRELTAAYDRAFEEFDILAFPTTPQTAHPHRSDLSLDELMEYTLNMTQNTAQFNVTGHPAISVPCGSVDGLPVGLMLVGEMFSDDTLLRTTYAFEQMVGHEWMEAV